MLMSAGRVRAVLPDELLSRRERRVLVLAPWVVMASCALILPWPFGRRVLYRAVSENRPVEVLTFTCALGAAVEAVRVALANRRTRGPGWVSAFFLLFAIGMTFIGGEEVAWGQQIVGFRTPAAVAAVNLQGELTLHNLGFMQGHNDLLRVSFGVCGLIGVALGRTRALRPVGAPVALLSWFAVIVLVGLVDTAMDLSRMTRRGWEFGHRLSEVVELFIAFAGLLYATLRRRALAAALDSPPLPK
jgi:hypothetical protein